MTTSTAIASVACLFFSANSPPVGAGDQPDLRCGSYSLYVALKGLDYDVGTYEEFEAKLGPPTIDGYSMGELNACAVGYGAQTRAVHTTFENLQSRTGRFACIAHINGNHFVNFTAISDGMLRVIDVPRSYSIPLDTMRTQWDGTALLVGVDSLVSEEELPKRRLWPLALGVLIAGITIGLVVLWRRRPALRNSAEVQ